MRIKLIFCVALILSGCAQSTAPLLTHHPASDFTYDERDAIPNDIPLPRPGVNQRPVVGVKKMLVSVVHWQDGDILKDGLIEKDTISTDPRSLRSLLLAASNGKLTLDGKIISYTSGPRPEVCKSGSPYPMTLSIEEGAKAAKANGLDPSNFDYLINVIDCGGYASAQRPGRIMGVYGQSGSANVYWHEFGHNLGYAHGNTYTKCPSSGQTVHAPTKCMTVGYGDTGDTVSGSGSLYPANNRWYSGWLDSSQTAVIERTGLYRLGVLGSAGPQVYLINRPSLTPTQIALEYRKPNFFDNHPYSDNRVKGVWVRYTTMAGSLLNTQLDGTPETATTADPTLLPGKVLKDETAGITLAVCTASHDGATVAIAVNGEAAPGCAATVISPPTIRSPDVGAPPTPNPVIWSGMSFPGARINVSYKTVEGKAWKDVKVVADATGNWRAQLPSLSSGRYNGQVWQTIGNSSSLANFRDFAVAP